jgi:hypothetical protein
LLLDTMVQEEGDRGLVVPKKAVSYWINALATIVSLDQFEPLRPSIFQKSYEDDTR